MAQRRTFSPRDEVYLSSTSFEVYMIVGVVFAFVVTAGFLIGVFNQMAWLMWPAIGVGALVGMVVLRYLSQREWKRKLAELESEYRDKVTGGLRG
ncbi:hypothetical protein HC891_26160 [Candidatus Gracilibacteria bacterium]|nr:hypothetical protein [Candidatus Gracilibacteria bacterium]